MTKKSCNRGSVWCRWLVAGAVFILCSCCATSLHGPYSVRHPSAYHIVADKLQRLTNCPPYCDTMQSSDVFLMVVLPGISLSLQELSFAAMSGNELWANIEQMDKAYRFYKLIDRVFLCDSVVKQESWLSLSDVIQGDMALQTYTSITYNDQYRLAIPSMPLRDTACMWTDINGRLFSTNIARIPVERCYMEYPVTIKPQYEHKKIAAIKELLLVKNLTVQKTAKDTIIHVQQAIVGFVCVIL